MFWLCCVASGALVVKGKEEYRVLAVALMFASGAWLVATHVWSRMNRRRRRRRRRPSSKADP
jgi:hypothetical protein